MEHSNRYSEGRGTDFDLSAWYYWIWGRWFADMGWGILKISNAEEEPQNGDVS